MLRVHTRGTPLAGDVDLEAVARGAAGFTGAELAALCRWVAVAVVVDLAVVVRKRGLTAALHQLIASLAPAIVILILFLIVLLSPAAPRDRLYREAALAALREDLEGATEVAARHFDRARAAASPALTMEQLARYEGWGLKYGR